MNYFDSKKLTSVFHCGLNSNFRHYILVFLLGLTCFHSYSQNCQSSYDHEDIYGEDIRMDMPFRCGTSMMEGERYRESEAREKKGFYDIEGLIFYGYPGYFKKRKQLYYSIHPDTFTLVSNGDVTSIEFVGNFIRDKNAVYSKGIMLSNVDAASFQVLENTPYAKDNNSVYYSASRGGNGSEGILTIEGANAEHFRSMCTDKSYGDCYYYGLDDVHVYYTGVLIPFAHAGSFQLVGGGYARDKNFVYFNGVKLEGSSGKSFEIIDYYYSKDKNNAYYYGKVIEGMNGSSFKLLGESGIGSDGVHICYRDSVYESGDPSTFVDLGCGYYKDVNNVYSRGQILKDLDPATFENLEWGFSKDKNGVYCDDVVIPNADPLSFEVLGRKYSRDRKRTYYLRGQLANCDRDTFKVDGQDPSKAEDSKAIYKRGKRTKK